MYPVGFLLLVVGIIVMMIAFVLMSRQRGGTKKAKGAGVILIGPIPIIFGTDEKSVKTVLVLAMALTIAAIIAMVVYFWFLR